jgi:DNA recombination protein RmuC
MQGSEVILILVALVGLVGFAIYYISNQIKTLKPKDTGDENKVLMEWLKQMKDAEDKTRDTIERQLKDQRGSIEDNLKSQREAMNQQTKLIWERLDRSQDVIREVQKQLGGIQEFGTDMKDLSNILKSPKLRGGLGEQFLYDILANALPHDLYKAQYKFKDGNICDAVVFTEKGIIPIDAKFPMENFKAMLVAETQELRDKYKKTFVSDVKKRIDEIASKYILPEEKTTNQALMYIPSENVYYELLVNTQEIEDYCRVKNVIMTSPNTLSYFLKVLLVAYQQHELEKHAGEIIKGLEGIRIEAQKFFEELSVLERHISNTFKAMDGVKNRFGKLFTKIENVHSIEQPEKATELGGLDGPPKLLEEK